MNGAVDQVASSQIIAQVAVGDMDRRRAPFRVQYEWQFTLAIQGSP
jgi:hypothetical protein